MKAAEEPLAPEATLISKTDSYSLCEDINIDMSDLINHGMRALKTITWSIKANYKSADTKSKFD